MQEIKKYAPVIIPTLNRYEHFKRCLESLEKCTGAEYTDVYVALDYPPLDKYVEGWKKIGDYLFLKEKNNKFKNLFVIRRERNYGVGHANSNASILLKEIKGKYDFYIFSEDDNEFSASFLEYMNACFIRFKDDDRIVKVCGYNFPMQMPEMYKNNFYISKHFCAWGNGSWTKKNKEILKYYTLDALKNIILDDKKYQRLKAIYPRGISLIHSMLKLKKLHGDAIYEIYARMEDKYFVLPVISKVRNYGNDGTGVHSLHMDENVNKVYSEQDIDMADTFEFTNDVFTYEPVGLVSHNPTPPRTLRSFYKSLVVKLDIWLLRHFNYLPKSKFI